MVKKHYKYSKFGFTLVELLAVIVILAIILAIAIPSIGGIIESVKYSSLNSSAQLIGRAIKVKVAQDPSYNPSTRTKDQLASDLGINGADFDFIGVEEINGKYKVTLLKNEMTAVYDDTETPISAKVYGLHWDGNTTFTRTDDATSLTNVEVATGNVDVTNDFDNAEIYSEMVQVIEDGNYFVKIPKFYIKKTVNGDAWTWQVSKDNKDDDYYLPACFVDETNGKILPYILVGKYNASLGIDDKLESKPNKVPLVDKSITQFRTYARNNNNETTIKGYQIMDIHVIDVLQTLFYIEFAKLDSQSVMYSFADGLNYYDTSVITAVNGNIITVPSGSANNLEVNQMVCIESSEGTCDIRNNWRVKAITGSDVEIEEIAGISTSPGTLAADSLQVIRNAPYLTGRTSSITLATSGSEACTATDGNTNGKCAMMYRGIENFYGNIWQFVDGINLQNNRAYISKNADDYVSNIFSETYAEIGYANSNTKGNTLMMGFDSNNPFINLPTVVDDETIENSQYKDYYWPSTGKVIAVFGGRWSLGSRAGASHWSLDTTSSSAYYDTGGRLVKTP